LHYSTLKPDTQVLDLRVVGEGGTTLASLFLSSTPLGTGDVAQRGYAEVQPVITALSAKAWISVDAPSELVFDSAEFSLLGDAAADRLLTLSLSIPAPSSGTTPLGVLTARTAAADGVVVGGTAQALTLTGTAEQLETFVKTAGKLLYTGQLTTLKASLQLANNSTASSSVNVVLAKNQVIDFAGNPAIAVTTGTGQALQLTHDGARGELMRASGGMQLSLAGFVHAGGTLAIEKSSQSVVLADGKSVQTDMLTVGGTDLQMFVGVGGPYRSDTNGDGVVNTDDDINDSAIGLSAVGGEFALGLFYEKSLSNPRNWIALQASLDEVAMVGVPGITAVGRDIAVDINLVNGVAAGSSANTQVINFAAKPLEVSTGKDTTATLDMAGSQGQLIRASGGFELNLGDFVYVNGTLGTVIKCGFEEIKVKTTKAIGCSIKV
jgi:hypothetical protein